MKPSVVIRNLDDVETYFGNHSHIKPLLEALKKAPDGNSRAKALDELVGTLKHQMNADVSALEAELKAA